MGNQFEPNLKQLTVGNDKFKPANNHLKPAHTICDDQLEPANDHPKPYAI